MPWKSEAQRKALHAKAARGEIDPKIVAEFDAATPKGAKLPEHVKPRITSLKKKGKQ